MGLYAVVFAINIRENLIYFHPQTLETFGMKMNGPALSHLWPIIAAALLGAILDSLIVREYAFLHAPFLVGAIFLLLGVLLYGYRLYLAAQYSACYLRNVLETTEDGFWLVDRNGRILEANRASGMMLGDRPDDMRGSYLEHYEMDKDTAQIKARIAGIIAQGHERFDIRLKTRQGNMLDIEASCSHDPRTDAVVISFRDISTRKATETEVRELSELNRLIIENSESGISVHKATGECILANTAAARIVGATSASMLQHSHNFRKSRSWRESGLLAIAETTLHTGELQMHHIRMHTSYGRDIWCLAYLSRLFIKGEPYLLNVFTDIMPIKQAEEAMRIAKEKAEASLNRAIAAEEKVVSTSEEIQRRLGQELHDGLGQKLTGGALLCKALEDRLTALGLPEAEDASRLVAQMNDAVNEARDIARGLFPVELHQHGLVEALQKLADNVPAFSGKACSFDWDKPPELSDETAFNLYRIAQEAVNNAIKHSGGNEIVISLQCGVPDVIRLSICDNGAGLGSAGAPDRGGIGIRVMQFRARLIGAELSIRAEESTGTEVIATLPVALFP